MINKSSLYITGLYWFFVSLQCCYWHISGWTWCLWIRAS